MLYSNGKGGKTGGKKARKKGDFHRKTGSTEVRGIPKGQGGKEWDYEKRRKERFAGKIYFARRIF